jgi:hypothetical protein
MAEISLSAPQALIVQLLAWVASRPRRYGETLEAWRTSCPRLPVWEDALDDRLVEILPTSGRSLDQATVRLTPRGEAMLAQHGFGASRQSA